MKSILTILVFILSVYTSVGQNLKVDSLVKLLDNSQIRFDGNILGPTINLAVEPSNSLLNIGKPASEKLISVLEDSTKAIISHCILTRIWGKEKRLKTIYLDRDKITVYTYNELNFFVRPNMSNIYANSYELKINKLIWQAFVNKNSH